MGQVTLGTDGGGSLSRRVGKIERFLNGITKQRIRAENETGKPYVYPVLAGTAVPGKKESVPTPFKITATKKNGIPKYKIAKGSIQDGTNGAAIDLSALLEEETTATAGYVVIEADVDEDMVVSGWALAIHEDAADAAEVRYTEVAPIRQDKIRLLIGKITLDEDDVPTAWQALFTSVRIIYGLQNGVALKLFEAAPTVASAI